jgi:hypothetical protein
MIFESVRICLKQDATVEEYNETESEEPNSSNALLEQTRSQRGDQSAGRKRPRQQQTEENGPVATKPRDAAGAIAVLQSPPRAAMISSEADIALDDDEHHWFASEFKGPELSAEEAAIFDELDVLRSPGSRRRAHRSHFTFNEWASPFGGPTTPQRVADLRTFDGSRLVLESPRIHRSSPILSEDMTRDASTDPQRRFSFDETMGEMLDPPAVSLAVDGEQSRLDFAAADGQLSSAAAVPPPSPYADSPRADVPPAEAGRIRLPQMTFPALPPPPDTSIALNDPLPRQIPFRAPPIMGYAPLHPGAAVTVLPRIPSSLLVPDLFSFDVSLVAPAAAVVAPLPPPESSSSSSSLAPADGIEPARAAGEVIGNRPPPPPPSHAVMTEAGPPSAAASAEGEESEESSIAGDDENSDDGGLSEGSGGGVDNHTEDGAGSRASMGLRDLSAMAADLFQWTILGYPATFQSSVDSALLAGDVLVNPSDVFNIIPSDRLDTLSALEKLLLKAGKFKSGVLSKILGPRSQRRRVGELLQILTVLNLVSTPALRCGKGVKNVYSYSRAAHWDLCMSLGELQASCNVFSWRISRTLQIVYMVRIRHFRRTGN